MMVPDFTLIAEIMMFSEGFSSAKILAKKMIAIMELSQQQLSKQDHYDYGLRSFVIPIARAAGSLKRVDPDASEEVILYRWGRGVSNQTWVHEGLEEVRAGHIKGLYWERGEGQYRFLTLFPNSGQLQPTLLNFSPHPSPLPPD